MIVIANGSAFVLTAALASYLTEQLRATGERLKEREVDYAALSELHGSILRGMSAGIVTTDIHGRITFMNSAAEQILGVRSGRHRRDAAPDLVSEVRRGGRQRARARPWARPGG